MGMCSPVKYGPRQEEIGLELCPSLPWHSWKALGERNVMGTSLGTEQGTLTTAGLGFFYPFSFSTPPTKPVCPAGEPRNSPSSVPSAPRARLTLLLAGAGTVPFPVPFPPQNSPPLLLELQKWGLSHARGSGAVGLVSVVPGKSCKPSKLKYEQSEQGNDGSHKQPGVNNRQGMSWLSERTILAQGQKRG